MQSNMAATLNIDWVVDRAREAAELLGHAVRPARRTLATLDARVLEARPAAAIYHPYIHEAGERGPFVDVNARAQFIGPVHARPASSTWCARSTRAWRFAARDCYGAMGHVPEEIRLAGGAARSKSLQDDPGRGPGRAGARQPRARRPGPPGRR